MEQEENSFYYYECKPYRKFTTFFVRLGWFIQKYKSLILNINRSTGKKRRNDEK